MSVSAEEQLMIELINRARLDPLGEALRLGFSAQEIAAMNLPKGSAQALASVPQLQQAAANHSSWMLATDTFSHTGANGSSAGDRMEQAGYSFVGPYAWGENIGYRGSSGNIDPAAATYLIHRALFDSDGHRVNMLKAVFAEVGIGEVLGNYLGYNTVMVTQNFATTGGRNFLTGVAYDDDDNDGFYSVGEGVSGVRFAIGSQATTSQSAGGYNMQFDATGWHLVSVTGGGVSMQVRVYFDGDNVKLDLVDRDTLQSSATMELKDGAKNAVLLGLDNLNMTGNAGGNELTGNGGRNAIWGLAGNDLINGGAGDDTMAGGAGNDTILGGLGTDRAVLNVSSTSVQVQSTGNGVLITSAEGQDLYSGVEQFQFTDRTVSYQELIGGQPSTGSTPTTAPNMQVNGTARSEVLTGNSGADILRGSDGFDTLLAGHGNDTLYGQNHADKLHGGAGNDLIDGGNGFDALYGELGNDTLRGGNDADRMFGGAGEDVLFGGQNIGRSVDGLWGEAGNDTLYGMDGFDYLDGGSGNDLLDGGNQADNLYGRIGDDTLRGGDGLDRLFGGWGDDFARGGSGNDGIFGEQGNDALHGESGNDRLFGGIGNDQLNGGTGNDVLYGGAGFDKIIGGAGNDRLFGNFNADTFIFTNGHGDDVIVDFDEFNDLEKIDLSDVSGISNWFDLANNHMTQQGANVIIDTGNGNSITLLGVQLSDLDQNDFIL